MRKENKSIRAKVTVGYLLLTTLLFFSIWFVYQEMKVLAEPDISEAELDAKRKITNNTLAKLYRSVAKCRTPE